ncbi:sigma-54-dependent transcriptional regulator [Pelosinus sp. sgz500959]|uniref:sigma-54-dependent transcriptional regulator n=1 Tax=Pelosinus sp. sgz500959 TaxID=3242472 RepID=UPI0036708344
MNILVVDDEPLSRGYLAKFLTELGHSVIEVGDSQEAIKAIQNHTFILVISDISLPGMSGLELLCYIKANVFPVPEIILMTGFGDMDTVLAALRAGAYDYLRKPLNFDELEIVVERIAEHYSLKAENHLLTNQFEQQVNAAVRSKQDELTRMQERLYQEMGLNSLSVFSDSMKEVIRQAEVYRNDRSVPVLIEGETGVGKELIARYIHGHSEEISDPFIDINCAAIAETLFESELFGYEGGAFSGALAKGQKGKFELANAGSLFLDEIGEMPLLLQAKLLRVLEERQYYRVGGIKKITLNTRIIGATNVNLQDSVERGTFRRDLFFRLHIGYIRIPPLRERTEDILPLAKKFLIKFGLQRKKRFHTIHPAAEKLLLNHTWPGNVRELRNLMEWVTLMFNEEELTREHLVALNKGAMARDTSQSSSMDHEQSFEWNGVRIMLPNTPFSLENLTMRIIEEALLLNQQNKSKTARYLEMSRRSLCYRLDGENHTK